MEFIRTESQTGKPFAIDYCLIAGEATYKALDRLTDDEILGVLTQESHYRNHSADWSHRSQSRCSAPAIRSTSAMTPNGRPSLTDVLGVESLTSFTPAVSAVTWPSSATRTHLPAVEDRLHLAEMLGEVLRWLSRNRLCHRDPEERGGQRL